jgi:hypothetical protein
MESELWAEQIERATADDRKRMGFGPFYVDPGGRLLLLLESIIRSPKPGARVPSTWPIDAAPGWVTIPIGPGWSFEDWCSLSSEWVFESPDPTVRRVVIVPETLSAERKSYVEERLDEPLELLHSGEAFAFHGMLFILPEIPPFVMNSFVFHPQGYEPLNVFVGYRGHTRPYSEVITPGVYRAHNHPNDESQARYHNKARIARNVVKQLAFERENVCLSEVQAMGVLQHYGLIGPTDILDLSYDLNVAKWFSLNSWDQTRTCWLPKKFAHHTDEGEAHDESSVVYTVIARLLSTPLPAGSLLELANRSGVTLLPLIPPSTGAPALTDESLPRNISPLWSERASRQSGFGLRGVGPGEYDSWGSVLGIVEHRFHPTFWPNGWDRIGGPQLYLNGAQFSYNDDMSALADFILPRETQLIAQIRQGIARVVKVDPI